MAKQKINSTTQNFTEIENITRDIVVFKSGDACLVIEASPVNFYLLSQDEQEARVYAYMSLLNSLSFAIQILIVSKKVNIGSYLSLIDQKIASEKTTKIAQQLTHYKDFIKEITKGENLLDKNFYIVIPFSHLELGAVSEAKKTVKGKTDIAQQAEAILASKKLNLITQLQRMGIQGRQLKTQDLAKLFYELFNQETLNIDFDPGDVKNIIL